MRSIFLVLAAFIVANIAYAESVTGIDSMLVGKQVLEVSERRQMTLRSDGQVTEAHVSPDGKYVAYLINKQDIVECRLAKISTGKTTTIMSRPLTPAPTEPPSSSPVWLLEESPKIEWAPDSSVFALQAMQLTFDAGQQLEHHYILIYSAGGTFKKCLALSDRSSIIDRLIFTPDSRGLILNTLQEDLSTETIITERFIRALKPFIQIINITTGASKDIYASPTSAPNLLGWNDEGYLLFLLYGGATPELHKIPLDGGTDQIAIANCAEPSLCSSNGTLAIISPQGLIVKNQMTGNQVELTKESSVSFRSWAPNGKMLFYAKDESINDVDKSRKGEFQSLWLSSISSVKLSMCIALDFNERPSCSLNCQKIAYISQGQLYVAELDLREPSICEKLAAGIPLSEEETKQKLQENGKQIAQAVLMYSDDYDGKLPPTDSVAEAIHDNLRDVNVFFRPGTHNSIFRYIDPGVDKLSDITNPSDTILGELDAGYGWIIAIYADAHVVVKQK